MIERCLSAVNSPGGHILICLGLLILYTHWKGDSDAHDVTIFALGILSRSMGAGNKPESQPPNTVMKEITSTQTLPPTEPVAPAGDPK